MSHLRQVEKNSDDPLLQLRLDRWLRCFVPHRCARLAFTDRLIRLWRAWPVLIAVVMGMLGCLTNDSSAQSLEQGGREIRPSPNIAFYYRNPVPVNELQAFDLVVLDPRNSQPPAPELAPHTRWIARLLLDPSITDSGQQRLAQTVQTLWHAGFRGFLLDDDVSVGDSASLVNSAEMVAALEYIRRTHPQAALLVRNRPAVARTYAASLTALVIDSLHHRPIGYGGLMPQVDATTRAQWLEEARRLQVEAPVPVIAVDYCPVHDRSCRRRLAQTLLNEGVQPYVTSPGLGVVGIGRIEVMPRKVLVVQALAEDITLDQSKGAAAVAMPLNYLGYDVRFLDVNSQSLPMDINSDRYAGIVVTMTQAAYRAATWRQWLLARIREGMRVAVLGSFGFPMDDVTARTLGLEAVPGMPRHADTAEIVKRSPLMGFEAMPAPVASLAVGIRVLGEDDVLLRVRHGAYVYDAAALTSWGAYSLDPYGIVTQDAILQYRWAVQPLEFFKRALDLPDMPVPDVTSENGRRLMFTHVDGDGFVSKAEMGNAANQYSAQVLHDRILNKYPIPMTISIVEGEVGPQGKYPQFSHELETWARKIFALPHVEIASHTYSHPFFWWQVDNVSGKRARPYYQRPADEVDPFSMEIPGYELDLDREISGSINYIQRLAPPGKRVVAMLWSGDAGPPALALRKAAAAGVLNMNGGMTVITRSKNSWAHIAPYGVARGERPDEFQVYAATMNENVYTNDWTGPFFGFERVLETFAMTDQPIRFKALNIYYHFYSATKKASLNALEHVFASVMKQPVFPIYGSEYIRRVLEWRRVAVAREGDRWLVRSGQELRQLRWPGRGVPDLSTAQGVAGYMQGAGGLYVHMGGDTASFRIVTEPSSQYPYIREASGFVRNFQRLGRGMQFEIGGYYKPFVEIADMVGCILQATGEVRRTRQGRNTWRLDLRGFVTQPVVYQTIRVQCE